MKVSTKLDDNVKFIYVKKDKYQYFTRGAIGLFFN